MHKLNQGTNNSTVVMDLLYIVKLFLAANLRVYLAVFHS